jgi:AcrR family transcriptional regulator
VVRAAIELFTENGYAATTLHAVAGRAGVSVQTIYGTFENKAALLAEALDVAIAGDDSAVVVNAREWMQAVWRAPTGAERLRAYAAAVRRIMSGAGPMFHVVATAGSAAPADPPLAALAAETERRRRAGATSVIDAVASVATLRSGLSREEAIDVLWLLNGPAVYRHLVSTAGWSLARYESWLGDAMIAQLLAEP